MMKRTKTRFGAWKMLVALPLAALLMVVGCNNAYSAITSATLKGHTLLTVTYSRTDGKRLPFGGVGYNKVRGEWDSQSLANVKVYCSGQGGEHSYGTWGISEFQTSKGLVNGKILNRYEKKLLKAIDRELLHNGKSSGSLSYITKAKADRGRVYLSFTANWRNGKPNGDADITLTVMENAGDTVSPSNSDIYDVTDTDPEFVGGIDSLYSYLARNIQYPEQAKNEKIQGRVFVTFVIEADGNVSNAKVLRGIGGGCDEEALRVVNAMPKWKPGMLKGKPVRVQYTLPILFKLQ